MYINSEIITTRVIFKTTPKRNGDVDVIAFLLDCPANPNWVLSYMHVGQHGEASNDFFRECTLATPKQYADLKAELEWLGYDLQVRKHWVLTR
jgi:hypothetical protein